MILKDTGEVDKGLKLGRLLANSAVRMLDRATRTDCFGLDEWNAQKVKWMHKNACWDFRYLTEHTWAYLSAKHLLSICAISNLSIQFSF